MTLVQRDRLRLSQTLYRASAYLVRVGCWAGGVFALVAPELVRVLLGVRWLPAVPALRGLVVFSMSLPLIAVGVNLLVATGESRAVLSVRLVQLAGFVPAVVVGVRMAGVLGAALASDAAVLVGLVALWIHVRRRVDLSLRKLLGPPLLALAVGAALATLVTLRLGPASDWARLLSKAALATVGYGGTLVALERRELRLALEWGLRALRRAEGR